MTQPASVHAIRSPVNKEERMDMWRLDEKSKRKYEAAERLGLTARLQESGWPGLSAKEAGRIGGALRARRPAGAQDECRL